MKNLGLDVQLLCTIARVSRSGYYQWLKKVNEPERDHEDFLLIQEIFEAGKRKYGWRMIRMKLEEQGVVMNHKKIIRIMKKYRLFAKIRRKNPYKMIMKKSLEHRTCENKLARNFRQKVPGTVFSTDITYLPFRHRFAYLSVVKDVASGEVVAWYLSPHIDMALVMDTVDDMEKKIASLSRVMIHSDQGFHYTNPVYMAQIKSLGMDQSMSRKSNCIDNAPIESFFGHLKDDVDFQDCTNFEELRLRIAAYMEYYNHERPQWSRKKMTPVQYRNHLLTER